MTLENTARLGSCRTFGYNYGMELIILIGIPGSGKSTYARTLGKPTLSLDAIRQQLYGDASILGNSAEVERVFRQQIETHAQAGQDIVLDATHTSSRRRQRMIRLGRKLGYDRIVGVWLQTPLKESLARNRKRERHVPDFVLRTMQRRLENQPPSLDEGFDKIKKVRG